MHLDFLPQSPVIHRLTFLNTNIMNVSQTNCNSNYSVSTTNRSPDSALPTSEHPQPISIVTHNLYNRLQILERQDYYRSTTLLHIVLPFHDHICSLHFPLPKNTLVIYMREWSVTCYFL